MAEQRPDETVFLQNTKPLELLGNWLELAKSKSGANEPSAMTLSTSSNHGHTSSRVVLLKQVTENGLVFFTNYNSAKAKDISENPWVAGSLFWDKLGLQINLSGKAEKISREESENYWSSRPRKSQLSQWCSHQSEAVSSRAELERLYRQAEQEFEGREVPCPGHWGGYEIKVEAIEFWVADENRLHDRFEFRKNGDQWSCRRLFP